jgi:UTP--glucose-1-phosphate uridylyltransferase
MRVKMKISKVIIPAAGLGTRFLPITKSIAKEMLPILNKPAIQYIIEEARASRVDNFIIVTAEGKESIEHYFTPDEALFALLKGKGKEALLKHLDYLIETSRFKFVNQAQQLGLGHAILMAKDEIKSDYFGVMLPDDIISADEPALYQLIELAEIKKAMIIAIEQVPKELISSYGIIDVKVQLEDNLYEVKELVEKPKIEDAPSDLGIIGRYILSSHIFQALEQIKPSAGGEIQLTDAIRSLLQKGHRVFAYKINGTRFDVGTPAGWVRANMKFAMLNGIHLQ